MQRVSRTPPDDVAPEILITSIAMNFTPKNPVLDNAMERPVFVLVHGGWHGGWCYQRTARILRARGFEVYAPTLSGLSDRAGVLSRGIGLSTHCDEIAAMIEWEDLHNVVLCGHSYGGMVISGAAGHVVGRLRAISYIDAIVPENGMEMLDCLPPDRRVRFHEWSRDRGFGWLVPPTPASMFNVNQGDAEWVDRLCTPHPLRCFEEAVRMSEAIEAVPKQYIIATDFPNSSFPATGACLRQKSGWNVSEVHTGHDVMVDDPTALAGLLLECAQLGAGSV